MKRDGEDLSLELETAKTERRSRRFDLSLIVRRGKTFISLVSLLKVQQQLQQFSTWHFLDLSSSLPPNLLS